MKPTGRPLKPTLSVNSTCVKSDETEGLFKFNLETWLDINMPYFNQLFESELLEFDPLTNSEMTPLKKQSPDTDQTDNRDILKQSTENGKVDQSSSQQSTSAGTQSTDTNSQFETTESGSKDTTGQRLNDNFERDLESNNPDSRLAITTNDGQGVIEYASQINEKNANNKERKHHQQHGRNENSEGFRHNRNSGNINRRRNI